MSLDDTAKEKHLWLSLKKYFIDSIYTAEGIELIFDKSLTDPPTVEGQTVTKWVTVKMDEVSMDALSDLNLDVWCCTRKDPEWHDLSELRDTVYGYLTDNTGTTGARVITFYNMDSMTSIGGLVVNDIYESARMRAEDGTNYKILSCQIKFASKV